ncbi:MAG: hypothetical protein R3B09_25110 [Nannocystaceae bacterium]
MSRSTLSPRTCAQGSLDRRRLLGLLLGAGAAALAGPASASDRVIDRRLELWRGYAGATRSLWASIRTTRHASILAGGAPRTLAGALIFVAPGRLLLHDDDPTGSTTLIDGDRIDVVANDPAAAPAPHRAAAPPAMRWLARHLVAAFAPGDGSALSADARLARPRGAGLQLTVLPPVDSPIRRTIRSLTIALSPTSGAVERLEIAETAGDRLILALAEHQQNLPSDELRRRLAAIEGPAV